MMARLFSAPQCFNFHKFCIVGKPQHFAFRDLGKTESIFGQSFTHNAYFVNYFIYKMC